MFSKCFLVLKDLKDAVVLSEYLKRIKFIGKVKIAVLDVGYIPVNHVVTRLRHPEWVEEASKYFKEFDPETIIVQYDGLDLPAKYLAELAKKEKYDLILVVRASVNVFRKSLASSLMEVSPIPIMVVPA